MKNYESVWRTVEIGRKKYPNLSIPVLCKKLNMSPRLYYYGRSKMAKASISHEKITDVFAPVTGDSPPVKINIKLPCGMDVSLSGTNAQLRSFLTGGQL